MNTQTKDPQVDSYQTFARSPADSFARSQTDSFTRSQTDSFTRSQTDSFTRSQTDSFTRSQTDSFTRSQTDAYARSQADTLHLPITVQNPDSYYRSRLYTAATGVNALVTAALPLLTLLPRLTQSRHWPDVATLREYLQHELKAFETQASANFISEDIILLGRLILIAAIDDSLLRGKHLQEKEWLHFQTLNLHDNTLDEHFFTILTRACEYPVAHIDLLELIYLCLANGYLGKYREQHATEQELRNLQDDLYNTIRRQRQFHDTQLHEVSVAECQQLLQVPKTHIKKYIAALALMLGLMYTVINYALEVAAQPMFHQIAAITAQFSPMDSPIE